MSSNNSETITITEKITFYTFKYACRTLHSFLLCRFFRFILYVNVTTGLLIQYNILQNSIYKHFCILIDPTIKDCRKNKIQPMFKLLIALTGQIIISPHLMVKSLRWQHHASTYRLSALSVHYTRSHGVPYRNDANMIFLGW